jgi:N-acetylneuraminic acid mutarotase
VVYGTRGQAAAGNLPGDRMRAAAWTDKNGNFWLFGGDGEDSTGNSGVFDDLWEFNPTSGKWAWIGGSNTVGTPNLLPGTYGTLQTPAASNQPGGREASATWTDSAGNLWLFGFQGYDSTGTGGWLNDLWEFQPSSGEWVWMGGSSTISQLNLFFGNYGEFGTLQTASSANVPGSRDLSVRWTDSKGNFWLFGGEGYESAGNFGGLNDLWRLQPGAIAWEWVSGSETLPGNSEGQPGLYGTSQTPAFLNTPGGRYGAASWIDPSGNLWLFGGAGYDDAGNFGELNDLWEFQPDTGTLPPAATPTFSVESGTYTTAQTVTISDSTPGATIYCIINGDTPAAVYTGPITISSPTTIQAIAVATGYANSAVAAATYTVNLPVAAVPTFTPATGTYSTAQTVTISNPTPGATIYYSTTGAATTNSTMYTAPLTVSTSQTIQAIAVASNYQQSSQAVATYTIWPPLSIIGERVWIGGSSTVPGCSTLDCGVAAVYGTLGQAAAGNAPGGREAAATWTDSSGNLWLFGGDGFDSADAFGDLNDLWEFNPEANEWT